MADTAERDLIRIASLRLFITAALLMDTGVVGEKIQLAYGLGSLMGHFSGSRLLNLIPILLLAGVEGCLLWLTFNRPAWFLCQSQIWAGRLGRLGALNWVFFGSLALAYLLLRFSLVFTRLLRFLNHPFIFGSFVLAGAIFLLATGWPGFTDASVSDSRLKLGRWAGLLTQCMVMSLVLYGVVYQVALLIPDTGRESGISSFPLSLNGYSEASRYYYASLFLAKSVYGIQAPLPVLHPTRYLLQAIPFIIPNLPVWGHRLWQVLLWLGFTWAGGVSLARRLRLTSRVTALLVAGWAFLFFFQGPIYYHLMACALLVLWGFDSQKFWRSTLVILAASVWAGISRINWYPVPGLLAMVLYLMEQPAKGKTLIQYGSRPAAWAGLGIASAYLANKVYVAISGDPSYVFGSSLTSSLLKYRLWPNATYGTGIVLALALTIFPLTWLILAKVLPRLTPWHPLRWLGIGVALGVLLVGDLVVSIKIGGGSNLHNLDAFLLMLALVGAYLFFDRMVPDQPERMSPFKPSWVVLGLVLVVPLLPLTMANVSLASHNNTAVNQGISDLQAILDQARPESKEVLFISQRQLLTFHVVKGVTLIPDYEMTFLMEMAMANNQDYLQAFDKDLRNHRFSMIITDPVGGTLQGDNSIFGEENNAYVTHIDGPLLTYYQPKTVIQSLNLQVLIPR